MSEQELVDEVHATADKLNELLSEAARVGIRSNVRARDLNGLLSGWMAVDVRLYRDLHPQREQDRESGSRSARVA